MNSEFVSEKLVLSRVKVLFEFSVPKPKVAYYRAVQSQDGSFRMEKRGLNAKHYRTVMWCGSVSGLYDFRAAVEKSINKFAAILNFPNVT